MGLAQDRSGGASRFHRLVVARRDTTDVTVALAEGKQGDTRVKVGTLASGSQLVARSRCGCGSSSSPGRKAKNSEKQLKQS